MTGQICSPAFGGTVASRRGLACLLVTCLICTVAMQIGCAGSKGLEKRPGLIYQTVKIGSHPVIETVAETVGADHAPMALTIDPRQQAASDFKLDLGFRIRDKGMHDTEIVWAVSTLFMMGMYPATCGHFELALTGDLYDRNGQRLKTWSIVENDTAFMWLFLGEDCNAEPSRDSIEKVAKGMLIRLYREMSADPAWPTLAGTPVKAIPLWFIDTPDDSDQVSRIIRTNDAFPNVTFDTRDAALADRTLRISFQFDRADMGLGSVMGRSMFAIFTVGLVSGCSPNELKLNAEVISPDGTILKTYAYSTRIRASMTQDNCGFPENVLESKKAGKMVRTLLQQIAKDRQVWPDPA